MNTYTSPTLTEYGDLASITAVAGGAFTGDVLVDINGNVILNGNQSIDACPTQNGQQCIASPP